MYYVKKRIEIAGAHSLNLPYESKCCGVHGHSWIITAYCRASNEEVQKNNGMVVDFTRIKEVVSQLDHKDINTVLVGLNPTAENIAMWIWEQIPECYRVDVQESEGNIATFTSEDLEDF